MRFQALNYEKKAGKQQELLMKTNILFSALLMHQSINRFQKIILPDAAEVDLDDAFIWYELNSSGLGNGSNLMKNFKLI
jgi:hypothetical protein